MIKIESIEEACEEVKDYMEEFAKSGLAKNIHTIKDETAGVGFKHLSQIFSRANMPDIIIEVTKNHELVFNIQSFEDAEVEWN